MKSSCNIANMVLRDPLPRLQRSTDDGHRSTAQCFLGESVFLRSRPPPPQPGEPLRLLHCHAAPRSHEKLVRPLLASASVRLGIAQKTTVHGVKSLGLGIVSEVPAPAVAAKGEEGGHQEDEGRERVMAMATGRSLRVEALGLGERPRMSGGNVGGEGGVGDGGAYGPPPLPPPPPPPPPSPTSSSLPLPFRLRHWPLELFFVFCSSPFPISCSVASPTILKRKRLVWLDIPVAVLSFGGSSDATDDREEYCGGGQRKLTAAGVGRTGGFLRFCWKLMFSIARTRRRVGGRVDVTEGNDKDLAWLGGAVMWWRHGAVTMKAQRWQ
ncbi:hypothetical protein NL676_025356 [Syzygium grande]|nr:hypothetical protein NL676_025356 [Syzygium grande]